jgi:competence protein ComFC
MDFRNIQDKIEKKASFTWSFFVDLLFPVECLECGQGGEWLCAGCILHIRFEDHQVCQGCGRFSLSGAICPHCKSEWALDGVLTALDYDRTISAKLIKTLKYSFVKDISPVLAKIFLKFYYSSKLQGLAPNFGEKHIIYIPVPLHPKRLRWRGFNQSELIARPIVEKLGGTMSIGDLIRIKNITPQTQFKGAERLNNIEGCFSFVGDRDWFKGKTVVLVDDVVTTGATFNECAKVLKNAGAKKVWGFAMARG